MQRLRTVHMVQVLVLPGRVVLADRDMSSVNFYRHKYPDDARGKRCCLTLNMTTDCQNVEICQAHVPYSSSLRTLQQPFNKVLKKEPRPREHRQGSCPLTMELSL